MFYSFSNFKIKLGFTSFIILGSLVCFHNAFAMEEDAALSDFNQQKKQIKLRLSTQLNSIETMLELAALYKDSTKSKHYQKAFDIYIQLAEINYADAQFELGKTFLHKYERNKEDISLKNKALKWFEQAAAQGYLDAQKIICRIAGLDEDV